MRKYIILFTLLITLILQGCSSNNGLAELSSEPMATTGSEATNSLGEPLEIATTSEANAIGITSENYPKIDGSTSTLPLVRNIYMSMFLPNDEWKWVRLPQQASKTMQAYEPLIAGDVDLILVLDPSQDIEAKVREAVPSLSISL